MAFNCGEAGCADGCCGSAECLPSARSGCGEIQPSAPAICAAAGRVIEAWESSPLRSNDGMLFERIEDLRATLSVAQAALQALAAEKDAEIAALKLQLETGPLYSTRLKAKRYDWLRNEAPPDREDTGLSVSERDFNDWGKPFNRYFSGDALDAAIDSAIALAAKEAK